jgi:hypothetical protein
MAVWYVFPILVCCTKKNLATLMGTVICEKNGVPLASAFLHSRTRERNVIYLMRIYSDCILVEKEKQVFSCVPCFFSSCF